MQTRSDEDRPGRVGGPVAPGHELQEREEERRRGRRRRRGAAVGERRRTRPWRSALARSSSRRQPGRSFSMASRCSEIEDVARLRPFDGVEVGDVPGVERVDGLPGEVHPGAARAHRFLVRRRREDVQAPPGTGTGRAYRVGGGVFRPQPPTPPYVRFRIRRFTRSTPVVDALPEGSRDPFVQRGGRHRLVHVAGPGVPPGTTAVVGRRGGTSLAPVPDGTVRGAGSGPLPLPPDDPAQFPPNPLVQILEHPFDFRQSVVAPPSPG